MEFDPVRAKYVQFKVAFAAHKPCRTCESADGKERLCPEGCKIYEALLDELEKVLPPERRRWP